MKRKLFKRNANVYVKLNENANKHKYQNQHVNMYCNTVAQYTNAIKT